MDPAQSLDALANLLTEISQKPYDVALHAQHIRLADSAEELQAEALAAREMMTTFLAAGDDVWRPLIDAKNASVDLETEEGVQELLAVYDRAEEDYLSIPLLHDHLEFLIDQHARYSSGEVTKPDGLGEVFSTEWTRSAIAKVVAKGIGHLKQGQTLWNMQRDWEVQALEDTPSSERPPLIERIRLLHLDRLQQPHADLEETAQSYSSFTTNFQPPQEYESLLVFASKIRSQSAKAYDHRERFETNLTNSGYSLDMYNRYIAAEQKQKFRDPFVLKFTCERAITEAAKRRFNGELGAEEALRAFWTSYCDAVRLSESDAVTESTVLQRAIKSVPGSGEIWARYIRFMERTDGAEGVPDDRETIGDIYARALATNLMQIDVEQIVPLVLARAGAEMRRFAASSGEEGSFEDFMRIAEEGIDLVRQASATGDSKFRLEKYLADTYVHLASPDQAIEVWQKTVASEQHKTSYMAWTAYTSVLIRQDKHDEARAVFKDICMRNIDWPEAVWEAWASFEHVHGTVQDIEACLYRVEKAQYQVNVRRAKEAERANYQAMQQAMEYQAANVPVTEAMQASSSGADAPMDVDAPAPAENSMKRKAEDAPEADANKRPKTEPKPLPLKRDRENSTVFVSELPRAVTEEDLTSLFKDCGKVREVKITKLPNAHVATVEFMERDAVPAALTKDKKRIDGQEIAVHLAWKSTLYITNFPEALDDAGVRELFGKFGVIFDVRWPSKKFKNTRRFCYLQYTSPSAADNALQLHGQELEPGLQLSVFISNPERKKGRSDQDANEREVYVAGLSKFTTKADLEKLFATYGPVKEVRMATNDDGSAKGFAFIEYEAEKDAQAALAANNYELKKRRIAVTVADSRVRSRNRVAPESGLGQRADERNRSIRVRNLPPNTQEGLLQQTFEKIADVKRVEVFEDKQEAVVELTSAAEAGKLLLRSEPINFNGKTLELSEEAVEGGPVRRPAAPPPKTGGGLFVPRAAVSRPRAGLGHPRAPKKPVFSAPQAADEPAGGEASGSEAKPQGKGQDDFRKMLAGGKQ
ncbi:hypothetical protein HGRIS_005940 [Hohenbuehelia grisea]|uniref:RRM domain-containing protein n=1 Tax=Hohenbuehelia grisea TaxID=104357 RepID=A0ABR3JYB2_9AGAR